VGGQIGERRRLVMSNCHADWGFEMIASNKGICVLGTNRVAMCRDQC